MFEKIVRICIENRGFVTLIFLLVMAAGVMTLLNTPLDAIPDLSDVQVIVYTEYPGQAPQVIEDQVTYPLTTTLLSVPGASVVRGYSFFGFSFVYVLFEDGTDLYWARSRVLEYLNFVRGRLPEEVNPSLGPDATGVGWVYEYVLTSDRHDLAQLRSLQDWKIRYELQTVPGVAEVASIGGYVKQYQVDVDPDKLLAYGIPLSRVIHQIKRSNNDVGGRLLEFSEYEFMVRGLGYIKSLSDLESIPLTVTPDHVPVRLADVASIHLGPEIRRGLVDWNGEGEVVGGIVLMRFGENAYKVIKDVKQRLEEIKASLPEGVEIIAAYDRSSLIERAVENLTVKLIEESIVVALVCIIFLLHFRSALVAIFILPAGIILSFLVMNVQGVSANIMSLGGIAIAIGAMIPVAIVMIENMHKHLETASSDESPWEVAIRASSEVGPPLFFSLLIIAFSFLPVFSLQGQEGKLFKPLAYTKTYAMLAAALLSVTIVPILMGFFIRGRIRPESKNPISRFLTMIYKPSLRFCMKWRWLTLAISLVLLLITAWPASRMGSEFMPPLYEGDLLYMPTLMPGISITTAKQVLQTTDRILYGFPEVKHVFGKIGRAETATDPASLSMIETIIALKPENEWREGMTPEKLVKEMDAAINLPGVTNAWTMPIKTRIDMLSTGIKTPVGIKLVGSDLQTLSDIGEEIEALLRELPNTASVFAERVTGANFLDIKINREEAARYGLTVGDVQDVISSAIGGMNVTQTVEGLERYPVNVRYGRELREDLQTLNRVQIPTPMGHQVPLAQVADIEFTKGPPVIKTEGSRPNAWIYVDVKGADIGGYVAEAQRVLSEGLELPDGYQLIWSGQFEYMERASARLRQVVPVTLLIVFMLLYMSFKSMKDSLIVMLSLPFAMIGGVWFIYILGYNMSVAVGVGFIALAGVAAELGMVLIMYMRQTVSAERGIGSSMLDREGLARSVLKGAVGRVRPTVMTATAIMAGLLPILWGHGAGASVMKRIAAPMVGGMISAAFFTLLVLPIIYQMVHQHSLRKRSSDS